MKGVFEFEVDGKKRGFKFGTYAFAVACEKEGCSINELQKRIGDSNLNIMVLLHLFYGAAVHYAAHKKIEVDFTTSEVSDWLDELGYGKVTEILNSGLNVYQPKNSTSPQEKGETVTQ